MSFLYEIPSGQIAEGVQYQVTGTGTSIVYNSVTYNIGDYFVGVAGITDYTKTDGTEIVIEASSFIGFAVGEEDPFFLGKYLDDSTFKGLAFGTADPRPGRIVRTIMPHDIPEKITSFYLEVTPTSDFTANIKLQYSATARAPYLTVDWGDGSPTEDIPADTYTVLQHDYAASVGSYNITFTGATTGITTFIADNCKLTKAVDLAFDSITQLDLSYNDIDALSLRNVIFNNGDLNLTSNSALAALEMPVSGSLSALDVSSCNITSIDLSNLDINGDVVLNNNNNLTSVTFKSDNVGTISYLTIRYCNITGTLDLSGVDVTGLVASYNSNLTEVVLKDGSTITQLDVQNSNITGTLDMSKVILDTDARIYLSGNKALTTWLQPTTSGSLSVFIASDCDLTGTLDLSNITLNNPNFIVSLNANLTGITFSNSNNTAIGISAYYCDLTGTLDLSSFSAIGNLRINNNANLTGITFSSNTLTTQTQISAQSCNLTGVLDLSNVPVVTRLDVYNNPNLTGVTLSTTGNGTLTYARLYDTDLTGTLDLSNVVITDDFRVGNSPNLTEIVFGNSTTQRNSYFYVYNTGLTSLDLSGFIIDYYIYIYSNPELVSITWPSRHTSSIRTFFIYDNAKLESIDLDAFNLTSVYSFAIYNNPALTTITNTTTSYSIVVTSTAGINLSNNTAITSLDVTNIDSSYTLNLSGCTALSSITFASHKFNSINLNNTAITDLDLTNVDFTTVLTIYAEGSQLSTFKGLTLGNPASRSIMFNGAQISTFEIQDQYLTSTSDQIDLRNNNMLESEVDSVIINLAAATQSQSYPCSLLIAEGNAPRSTNSDAAYNDLISWGWTIN